jgi:hypothetical protein
MSEKKTAYQKDRTRGINGPAQLFSATKVKTSIYIRTIRLLI